MVEIARALAFEARLLIMDEPTAALGESEVGTLFEIVGHLRAEGLAVIFITHRLDEVFRTADRVVVLRDGARVGELPIAAATPDRLVQLMVGRPLEDIFRREEGGIGAPLLEVRGLGRRGAVRDVSFTLRRGEILGFAGLVGAGRTETARLIFGADRRDAGEILLEGRPLALRSPGEAVAAGIGLVPENRALQGLVLGLPVQENIGLATLDRFATAGWVRRSRLAAAALDFIRRLTIRTPTRGRRPCCSPGATSRRWCWPSGWPPAPGC